MPFGEAGGEGVGRPGGAQAQFGGGALGGGVQRVDVVVLGVEEVPYLVVRFGGRQDGGVVRSGEGGGLFGGVAVAAVQGNQGAGYLGVVTGDLGDLLGGRRGAARLVAEGGAQVGGEAFLVGLGEVLGVDAQDFRDAQQDGGGERTPALFDLVEVAGGDTQGAGELHLVEAVFAAEPAQLGVRVDLADGRSCHTAAPFVACADVPSPPANVASAGFAAFADPRCGTGGNPQGGAVAARPSAGQARQRRTPHPHRLRGVP